MSLFNATISSQNMVEQQIVDSVFTNLPQNSFTDFLIKTNSAMSHALMNKIPENSFTHFFITNPLLFLIIFFILAIIAAIFLDFLPDAWKMPFAMAVDIIDIMAIGTSALNFLDILAAGSAFLVFLFLARDIEWMRYIFGFTGAVKCLLPIGFIQVFPLNTVLMLISTIIDRGL